MFDQDDQIVYRHDLLNIVVVELHFENSFNFHHEFQEFQAIKAKILGKSIGQLNRIAFIMMLHDDAEAFKDTFLRDTVNHCYTLDLVFFVIPKD